MRILYLHQYFTTSNGKGGTDPRSYEYAKRLVAHGHEVIIVCGSSEGCDSGLNGSYCCGKREGVVEGIRVIQLQIIYSNHFGFYRRIFSFFYYVLLSTILALKLDYDLVFATSTPLTICIPAVIAKIFRKKHYVFEARDLWPDAPKSLGIIKNPIVLGAANILESIAYQYADACIGLSPGIAAGIKRKISHNKKILLNPNCCDLANFANQPKQFALPAEIKPNDFVAVYAGAHSTANGLHAILDAAREVKKLHRDDIKFLFVGDGKCKLQLIQTALEGSLDNCIFLNPVSRMEIPSLFSFADIGLVIFANSPALYYGTSPNKFFDYIASGLPIVSNYPGWVTDMIKEYNCGVAVPPGDPKAFAEAIIKLADNRQQLDTFGNNAKILANNFDRDKLFKDFLQFIEAVVK